MKVLNGERNRVEYLTTQKIKWFGILIGEKKLSKIEMYHLGWDKLKRKVCHISWDGGSTNLDVFILTW